MMENFPFEEQIHGTPFTPALQDGFITSLERRQRKSADRADTHRFFGVVTVVFLALAGLLILSELGTFLVHPESALTGRFVIEIYRSIYGVLRLPVLLFYEMQDVAWTLNAIVYGADFELRGLQVTRGIATVLLWTNVILAGAMTGFLLMYAALCAQSSSACLGPRRLGVRVGAICAPTLAYYCFAILTTRNFWRPGPQTATCLGLWTATVSLFVGWRSVVTLRPAPAANSCLSPELVRRYGIRSAALGWGVGLWTWVQVHVRGKMRQRAGSSGGPLSSSATSRRRAALGNSSSTAHAKLRGGSHTHPHSTSSGNTSSNGTGSSSGVDNPGGSTKSKHDSSSATSSAEPASNASRGTSCSGSTPSAKQGSSVASSAHTEPNPSGHKPPPTEQTNSKPPASTAGTKTTTSSKAAQKLERTSGTSTSSSSSSSILNPSSVKPTLTASEKATQATLMTQSQAAHKREQHAAHSSGKHAAERTNAPPPPPPPPFQSSSRAAATGRQLESLVMRNAANRPHSSESGMLGKTGNSTIALNKVPHQPITSSQQQQQQQRTSPFPAGTSSSSSLGALFGGLTGRSHAVPTANHSGSSHSSVHTHSSSGSHASGGVSPLSSKPNATAGASHAYPTSAAMPQQRTTGSFGNGTTQNSTRAVQNGPASMGKPFPLQPPPPSSSIVRPSIGSFAAAAAAGVAVFRAAVSPSLLLSMPTSSPGKQPPTTSAQPPAATVQSPLKATGKAGKGGSCGSKTAGPQPSNPSTPTKQKQSPPPPPPPPPHQQQHPGTQPSNGSGSPSPKPLNPSAPAFRYNPFVSPPAGMIYASPPVSAAAGVPGSSYSPLFDEQQRAYQQQDYDSYNLLHKQEQDLWQTVTSSAGSRHAAGSMAPSSATPLEQQQQHLPYPPQHEQQRQGDSLSFFTSGSMFSDHLIAHKHASGDLDLSSAAANYSPFSDSEQKELYTHVPQTTHTTSTAPHSTTVQPVQSALQQHRNMHGRAPGSDSEFSFFSTPPPCTTSVHPQGPALTHPSYGGVSQGMGFAEQLQQLTLQQHQLNQQAQQQRQAGGLFDASHGGGSSAPSVTPWFYADTEQQDSAISHDAHVYPTSTRQQVAYAQDSAAHSAGNTLVARLVMAATTRQNLPAPAAASRNTDIHQQQQQPPQGWTIPPSFLDTARLNNPDGHRYAYGRNDNNNHSTTSMYSYNGAYQGAQGMQVPVILPTGLPGSPLQECLSEFGFVESDSLPGPGPMGPLKSFALMASSSAGAASADEDDGNTCVVCWVNPRQVGFLHGNTSHLCVCRACASTMREGDRCVVCRALIERIIIIY